MALANSVGKLQSLRKQVYLNDLKPNQWWWD